MDVIKALMETSEFDFIRDKLTEDEIWKFAMLVLLTKEIENNDVLCHTNLKENAELIAKILDADARGEVFISTRARHINYHGYYRTDDADIVVKESEDNNEH